VQWVEDVASGKTMSRVGLAYVLHLLDEGQAERIVPRTGTGSAGRCCTLPLARAEAGWWNVVVLDLGLDLTTPHGEFTPTS
jgi:hypothetical protein